MKREIAIRVQNGKISVDSSVTLKDIASTLQDGNYTVIIESELTSKDGDYYRKRFYKGVDIVVDETANQKTTVEIEVKRSIIRDMIQEENASLWIDLDKVDPDNMFSFTWLTPQGWRELYTRFRFWAHNICDCYV